MTSARTAAMLFGLLAGPAMLFPDTAVAKDESENDSSEVTEVIVVTGSRIKRREPVLAVPTIGSQFYLDADAQLRYLGRPPDLPAARPQESEHKI
jgi:hypothetical protein